MLKEFEPTIIKLAKTYHIGDLEWQDIAQELRIHLWLKEKSAKEPIRSYKDWAYILCRRKIAELARYYKRKKRDSSKNVSLEALEEEGVEFEG